MGIGDLFHHGPAACWRRSRRVTGVSRVSVKSDASQSSCSRADCDVRRRSTIHYSDSCFMLFTSPMSLSSTDPNNNHDYDPARSSYPTHSTT